MTALSHRLPVTMLPTEFGARLAAALPQGAAGAWCAVRLTLLQSGPSRSPHLWWAKLSLEDQARGQVVREVFLGPLRGRASCSTRATLVHVPAEARDLSVDVFATAPAGAELDLRVLSRVGVSLRLAWHGAALLPAALWGSPLGAVGRVRAMLGQAPARAGQAPPYAAWIRLCERPPGEAALRAARACNAQIAVMAGPPGALAASLASAACQLPDGVPALVIASPADWPALSADWIVLIQAGEILAPGACAAFADAAAFCPWAEVLTADCDTLGANAERCDPLFKPGPDSQLPGSDLLATGAMAARRRHITASLPLRAQSARALIAQGAAGRIAHVPGVLSHVPGVAKSGVAKSGAATSGAAKSGAAKSGAAKSGSAKSNGQATHAGSPVQPSVTILIPSAARGTHVTRCLRSVAWHTEYDNFTIKLVISAPARARERVRRAVARIPRVAILPIEVSPFNYAKVNNEAARNSDSTLLLLMNDDVAPISRFWLSAMVAHMQDPSVGIVGARLLYGNGMVQHEGVIMGLANLCEHAGRLRDGHDAGPHGIGLLDREVCAVTGACLLIRACLYSQLGGMDEAYAVALNDVDLCLRARALGWRVVYCAAAVLHHYESLSLGRHYAGARAGLETLEVRRLRGHFADVIGADPFYSPLASLQPGREWQPAFPPRPRPPAIGVPPTLAASL